MEQCAIGIDIGSKFTVIAAMKKSGLEIVQSESGISTPYTSFNSAYRTVIGLGEGERKFGEAGSMAARSNFKDTVWGFSRFLGMKQTSVHLKEELKYVFAKCIPADNKGIAFELSQRGERRVYTPEQLCAAFLSKLRRTWESAGLSCKEAVLAVPLYFSSAERQALLDAAKIAGLHCKGLFNETSAIGLCYWYFRVKEFACGPRNVLFLDLGYSSLAVAVMNFTGTGFRIMSQEGRGHLGGRNMDYAVMCLIAEEFKKNYGIDFRESPKAVIRVNEAIEKARKVLSANTETQVIVESVLDDKDICYNITRKEFEKLINPLVDEIMKLCQQVLSESKLGKHEIHSVELIGEVSRIPAVIQRVQDWIGMGTSRTMNSADCIARGCALQCRMFGLSPIIDFNPFSIDIVYNELKPAPGKKVVALFERGEHFPMIKRLTFDNRAEPLMFQLKYSDPSQLPLAGPPSLGSYRTNPGAVKGKFVLVLKIMLDSNMIGSAIAAEIVQVETRQGRRIDLEYQKHGMADSKIAECAEAERRTQEEDDAIVRTKDTRNSLESYVYEMRAKIPGELAPYADEDARLKLMQSAAKTEKWLANEKKKHDKETYDRLLAGLKRMGDPVIKRYKAFANLAEHEIVLTNKIRKLGELDKELQQNADYMSKDRGRIIKLVNEQMEWMKWTGKVLAECSRLNDPTVKDLDYITRIAKIDEVRSNVME